MASSNFCLLVVVYCSSMSCGVMSPPLGEERAIVEVSVDRGSPPVRSDVLEHDVIVEAPSADVP